MSYKNLNLNREAIPDLLSTFHPDASVSGPTEMSPNQFQYVVDVEGKCAPIQFYFIKDGTTTIHYKLGKHPDVSEAIATYIKENGVADDRKNFSLAFKNVAKAPFELLVEYLRDELKAEFQEDKVENGYRIIKVRSRFNDSLTYKYYDNGTLQIQGKPLFLYLETTYFLSEFLNLGDIMAVQSKLYDISINPDDIDYELNALLPRAYTFLDDIHRKVLSSSLVLRKLKLPLSDYSPFAFPALRALEGYLRKLLDLKGVVVPRDGFGGMFDLNATRSSFILKTDYRTAIACTATSDAVQSA